MLTSYFATLAYYEKPLASKYGHPSYRPVVNSIVGCLERAAMILQEGDGLSPVLHDALT